MDAYSLADRLDTMQEVENQGRGVCCVQTLVTYLRRGQMDEARAVCSNEWDKIRSYGKIAGTLKESGLVPVEWV